VTILRTLIDRIVHAVAGIHRFEGFTLVDLLENGYRGRRCRICGTIDEDAWQFLGSRRAPRATAACLFPR
jgi:hypothetical protein